MYLQKPTEITLLNTENKEIHDSLTKKFLPESILVTIKDTSQLENLQQLPYFEGKQFDSKKTCVYICKDFTCSLPLDTIAKIEENLAKK